MVKISLKYSIKTLKQDNFSTRMSLLSQRVTSTSLSVLKEHSGFPKYNHLPQSNLVMYHSRVPKKHGHSKVSVMSVSDTDIARHVLDTETVQILKKIIKLHVGAIS